MERVNMSMQMGLNISVVGIMTEFMEKVPVGIQTEISKSLPFSIRSSLAVHLNIRYSGEWNNGRINGKGTIYLANGDQYSGEWKDARRHGIGVYIYK